MRKTLKGAWIWLLILCIIVIYIIAFILIIYALCALILGKKSLGDVAGILAGAATSLSVVYLAEQIRVSIEQEKIKRSYDYFARYNSEPFRETITEALSFIRDTGRTRDQRWDLMWNKNNPDQKKTRSLVTLYFNFFEDMAILYNRGLLNKNFIQSFFKSISLTAYNDGKDCIDKLRTEEHRPTYYKEWEKMNKEINETKITGE